MNDLLRLHQAMTQAVTADAMLGLIQAICVLDPLWGDAPHDEMEVDGAPPLIPALRVLRPTFPAIYAAAIEAAQAGLPDQTIERQVCDALTAEGLIVEALDFVPYGIPLEACGAALNDPDFYAHHLTLQEVVGWFGLETEAAYIDVPQSAYETGRKVAAHLSEHPDSRYRQIGQVVAWLFGCSGNSLVDCDAETLSEIEPLSWDAEDVAFAKDMIVVAEAIMSEVWAGVALLKTHPKLKRRLQRLVERYMEMA